MHSNFGGFRKPWPKCGVSFAIHSVLHEAPQEEDSKPYIFKINYYIIYYRIEKQDVSNVGTTYQR
jgi:hypothetical protein